MIVIFEKLASSNHLKARYSMCGHAHPWTFQNEKHKSGIENSYQATVQFLNKVQSLPMLTEYFKGLFLKKLC